MPSFRRWYCPGGTYFFTQVTYGRRPILADPHARRLLGHSLRRVAGEFPFRTLAIVLLPDHLHCLWSLPPGDGDFSGRWRSIKRHFTRAWLDSGGFGGVRQ